MIRRTSHLSWQIRSSNILYLRYCDLLVGSKLFYIQNYVIMFAVCLVTAFSLLSNRNLRKSREPVNQRCQYRISISTDISFFIFYLMSGRRCPSLPIWVLRQLVAWHSGRTSIFGRWTFPVLRSTCWPAFVAEWLTHSAAMCSRAWRAQWPGFDSARARPSTKELFLLIPMHMMNREIIPGR